MNACDSECAQLAPRMDHMWEVPDGYPTTAPVGSFPKGATPNGLVDMAGNVAEWTASIVCEEPGKNCDPNKRMVRGSGWDSFMRSGMRGAFRFGGERETSTSVSGLGFRCMKSL